MIGGRIEALMVVVVVDISAGGGRFVCFFACTLDSRDGLETSAAAENSTAGAN